MNPAGVIVCPSAWVTREDRPGAHQLLFPELLSQKEQHGFDRFRRGAPTGVFQEEVMVCPRDSSKFDRRPRLLQGGFQPGRFAHRHPDILDPVD